MEGDDDDVIDDVADDVIRAHDDEVLAAQLAQNFYLMDELDYLENITSCAKVRIQFCYSYEGPVGLLCCFNAFA